MCHNCESIEEELNCENTTILDELDLEIKEHIMQLVRTQEFYDKPGIVLH